ncbi:store-operated calcium entry-associated regulatory factor [Acrodontium crateriforme]|uniref:Store-operated calcium entry-associated regulatory factor n=1 Tax=Acrodontium crateriforme TaxID=150365 RepID=A0AAQ3R9K5_9PEZI|nr:store-operated calcium entry-associated regulatory factor [Acrodontium crateriforme]
MRSILSLAVTLLLTINPTLTLARKPANSILLSTVKSLTLRDGQKTSHRRVSAMPQLSCVGGSAKGLYKVDVMRCTNSGSEYDAEDIQWTCKASLPPEFKLGSTDVICEGYDSPDDPYVLKGSCGVEYRLLLTDLGEEKYGRNGFGRMVGFNSESTLSSIFSALFWFAFIGIACLVVYRIFVPVGGRGQPPRRRGGGWGSGGGGGDGGHDDPPPPYSPRAKQHRSSTSRSTAAGWQPGFWSGTAAGAAAGYMLGNRNNNRIGAYQQNYGQAGPSNWFGGGRNQPTYGSGGYGAGPSSFGSSSTSPSSSRQESTGFGGTRRR